MIVSANELNGCHVAANDGEIGKVCNVYFDDERWTVRYLIVDTGGWLSGRQVLVSPIFSGGVDLEGKRVQVDLTRSQIERAPDVDAAKPVSRQMEAVYARHYNYAPYWVHGYGGGAWGWGPLPTSTIHPEVRERIEREMQEREAREVAGADVHLRSAGEVRGYAVEARDGSIGHIDDFLFDDDTWTIRHVVVDTRNWWPGKHVIVSPQSVHAVDWLKRTVAVDLTREEIKGSPAYDRAHLAA